MHVSFFIPFPFLFLYLICVSLSFHNMRPICFLLSSQTGNKEDIEKYSKRTVKVCSFLIPSLLSLFYYLVYEYCRTLEFEAILVDTFVYEVVK